MAEAKTQPTTANAWEFIAGIPDPQRRQDCLAVAELMQEVSGEAPVMWGESMVGFGKYAYKYASGRTGEWPRVGFASRKDALTLYFCGYLENHADLLARLGKHKVGKGCLYIKRLSDVDAGVLRELVARSVAAAALTNRAPRHRLSRTCRQRRRQAKQSADGSNLMSATPPRWDLSNVFPGLNSPEFAAAMQQFEQQVAALERTFDERVPDAAADAGEPDVAALLGEILGAFDGLAVQSGTLGPYIASFVATDSRNMEARRLESELEQVGVRLRVLGTRLQAWVGRLGPGLDAAIAENPVVASREFAVREMAEQSRYLMPEELEAWPPSCRSTARRCGANCRASSPRS